MALMSFGPGDDIDAWCGKCLMVMNHRIIAVVGSQVKKVECLTCHAVHAFKPGLGVKKAERVEKLSSVERAPKKPRGGPSKPDRAEKEWKTFMADSSAVGCPRKYSVFEIYNVSEIIEHPTFGTGRVLEITGVEKMLVIFRDGRKTLICNRKKNIDCPSIKR